MTLDFYFNHKCVFKDVKCVSKSVNVLNHLIVPVAGVQQRRNNPNLYNPISTRTVAVNAPPFCHLGGVELQLKSAYCHKRVRLICDSSQRHVIWWEGTKFEKHIHHSCGACCKQTPIQHQLALNEYELMSSSE